MNFSNFNMEDIIGKVIAGLIVVIITSASTWFIKRKFSLRFRHTIRHGDLNEFLTIIKKTYPDIKTIKILANVTNLFLPAFQSSGLKVIDMQILLRKPDENCNETESDYKGYFKTIIKDWLKLEEEGTIKKLDIRYFDFLTTDWQVIIDDKFIILGLNVPQKENWKKFDVTDTILIAGDSLSEKSFIKKYSNRFDRFFKKYGIKKID